MKLKGTSNSLQIMRILLAVSPMLLFRLIPDVVRLEFFAYPAAYLSTIFASAANPVPSENGYCVVLFSNSYEIVSRCSAVIFCSIVYALTFFTISANSRTFSDLIFKYTLSIFPAYLFAVFVNSMRFVLFSILAEIFSGYVQGRYFALIHMAVGSVIFGISLLAFISLIKISILKKEMS